MPSSGVWRRVDVHGATPQKTAFFIVTAVKTSNINLLTLLPCSKNEFL
jgi:hypothetical protein